VAERLKKCQHQEKGLTQILQRKTGTILKIKNKKIPNYFVQLGIVLFAAISTALKNGGKRNYSLTTTH
jgi:hypothetical protein